MTTLSQTALDVIDFLNARASSTNLTTAQFDALSGELRARLNALSVDVPGLNANATTLVYSGQFADGTHTGAVATALAEANPGSVRVINQTETHALLTSRDFETALRNALGPDGSMSNAYYDRLINGTQPSDGSRLPDSLWDDASRRFAESATGDVRTLTGFSDPNRVYAQTELAAILDNGDVTHINGYPKQQLLDMKNAGVPMERIQATVDAWSSSLSTTLEFKTGPDGKVVKIDGAIEAIGSGKFFEGASISGNSLPDGTSHISGATLIKEALDNAHAPGSTSTLLPNGVDGFKQAMREAQAGIADYSSRLATELTTIETRGLLNKLGLIGDAIALGLIAHDANAAYAEGDNARGNQIVFDGLLEFAGGAIVGTAAALGASALLAAALPAAFLAGIAGTVIAGALALMAGFAGGIAGERLAHQIANSISTIFDAAQRFVPRRDPLTLDLDGDGLETVPPNATNPILFDHTGDGIKTGTGWVKGDDGFLVLDRDGNGTIDSGRELFGDNTPIFDTEGNEIGKAEDGFDALAQEDTNNDGVVNAQDARWSELRIWQDLNQNAISDPGELKTMAEAGIASINVSKTEHSRILPGGNEIADLGSYTRTDGTTGSAGTTAGLADINLAADTFHRSFTDSIPLTAEIETLPDMQGSGLLRDLRQAASIDSAAGDALATLLTQYAATNTRSGQLAELDNLLIAWAATSGVPDMAARVVEHGASFSTNLDPIHQARLTTLENFNGRPFYRLPWEDPTGQAGVTGMSVTTDKEGQTHVAVNMNGSQVALLDQAYAALKQSVYDGLLLQTRLKPYLDAVSLTIDDTGIGMDFTGVDATFQSRYQGTETTPAAPAEAVRDLLDLQRIAGTNLNGLGWDGYGQLRGWLSDAATNSDLDAATRSALMSSLVAGMADFGYPGLRVNGDGTNGNEAIIGNDAGAVLNGNGGNDLILGGNGDDILNGGSGNDVLYGGAGNDTYVFNLGDGQDTIIESHGDSGTDTLRFGAGILAGDITITRDGDNLVFSLSNGRDKLSVANWFDSLNDPAHRLDTVTFADGSRYDLGLMQIGTDAADSLTAEVGSGETAGNAILLGNGGADTLTGNIGNDWLDGGSGADLMAGGMGDDLYVVDNPNDQVIELEGEGTDTVDARTSATLADNVENLRLVGSANLSGTGNELDNILTGNAGNNALYGLAGDDTLSGGAGNDLLDGGEGADLMMGGTGDDGYVVDTLADQVIEQAGQGKDTVYTALDYTLGQHIENLTLTGNAAVSGTGNELDNLLTGNAADNTLMGLAGNDTLDGGAGADTLLGGTGDDTYIVDHAGDIVIENANEGTDLVKAGIDYTLTDHTENLTLTGTQNLTGTGNTLDNVLTGNAGNNTLIGLEGNDTLDGGQGADTLIGGVGNDTYVVDNVGDLVTENLNEGTDTVKSAISYALGANLENLTLIGGHINGTGNELDNVLTGSSGNNILDGGAGADQMAGGHGDDTYIVDNAGDTVIEQAGQGIDTVIAPFDTTLGTNVENLILTGTAINGTGNELNNVLTGNAENNTLTGLAGDDTLDGGAGADTLLGGSGNDTYIVDDAGDRVIEQAGEGADTVKSSITYTLTDHVESLTLTGSADIDGTGNELNNVIIGNAGNNVLMGRAGNDTYVVSHAGHAVVEHADEGMDLVQSSITYGLTANVENLTLTGTANLDGTGNELANVITGNSGNNVLDGGLGNDSLYGGAGSDTLLGGAGNDLLDGGTGADTLIGGVGNDTYIVDNTADVIVELADEGTDSVLASASYTLSANVENLTLTGTGSIDGTGNAQDNTLTGNAGNNRLDGGAGADQMIGGAGNDTYVVDHVGDVVTEAANAGTDTVEASVSYALAEHVENLTLTGMAEVGAGNTASNLITGNAGDNLLFGMDGDDTLFGNAGNDTLDGGSGADRMAGGTGDDTYVVDNSGDRVAELAGEGNDTVQSSISYTLTANVERLVLTGSANIDATGNELDNVIVGNAGANRIDGGAGADVMVGGAGDDTYVVDVGDTVVEHADEGIDTVLADGDRVLEANVENLILSGTANLSGTGNALDNVITGNAGNNLLDGGAGADSMAGGLGDDTYVVDEIADVVIEAANAGTDTVLAGVTYTLSDNVENLTLTGSADLNGTGNALDNVITANAGINVLAGGAGNDTYIVNDTADMVVENANEGTDLVQSSATYTLSANVENLTLTGIADVDGTGNSGNNVIVGNGGNNVIDGGAGADVMQGGAGNDTYIVENAGDVVTETASAGTDLVYSSISYTLTSNVENLTLTGTSNLNGTGNTLNNVILGNTGNNRLDGGAGADSMAGGLGNDTYVVDNTGDLVTEAADEGTDSVESSISYTLTANVENLTLTGTANINGTGNALDNVLTGNSGNNALYGLAGNDTLNGGSGNDTLDGGTGADTMAGGAGNDTYVVDDAGDVVIEAANAGTDTVQSSIDYTLGSNVENLTLTGTAAIDGTGNALNNVITGNAAANVIDAGAGDDTVTAGAGADTLMGGAGNDTLNGGLDADTMMGGTGNDTYVVDNVGDLVIENVNEGTDLVQSSITYTLTDNVENLTLTGTTNIAGTGNVLDNVIVGNSGANALYGLEGNDTLNGGAGADAMTGGTGNDTYIVDNTGDTVIEAQDEGIDLVQSSVTYTLSANVENLTLTGSAAISGTGNALNNVIVGNSGNNGLYGLAGNDTLTGNAGNDVLDGGLDADTMAGGAGNDTYVVDNAGDLVTENLNEGTDLVQSSITYTLTSNVENLTLTGTAAIDGTGNTLNNVITGNAAANVIDAGAGDDTVAAGAGDDMLIGGDGNDSLSGEAGNDTLYGNAGNDTLNGGLDADTMAGGIGNDTYVVDNVGDLVIENVNEGTDLVQSSITYTLTDNVENLTLTGTANIAGTGNVLNNVVTGNSGANTLYGLEGNDTLDGGAGADTLVGGIGNDTYVVDNAADVVVEALDEGTDLVQSSINYTLGANVENLTLTGTAAINGTGNELGNVIVGNSGNNSLYGLAGNDTLTGNAGNDVLDGGLDADAMAGGAGNDTYVVDNAGDVVTEAANEGTDLVQSSITYTLTSNVENLTLTGTADLNGTGNTLANVITGNSGNNVLDGGSGADTLAGGDGNDTYLVDNTADVIMEAANAGTDQVYASATYTLSANVENLTLTGTAAISGTGNTLDNLLVGNSANNTLNGDAGNDTLDGGAGADAMNGGTGDDTYLVDNVGDLVTEAVAAGTDTVMASVDYTLTANVENLILTGSANIDGIGNALDNVLTGNAGSNLLKGGEGNDTLDGGAGNDILMGGAGNDAYVFGLGSGSDHIIDAQGSDTLFVGSGTQLIGEFDLEAERIGDSLALHILGSEDFITLDNWYAQAGGIDRLVFGDGATLDRAGIEALRNRPPVANADSITVREDGGALTFAAAELLANDTDPNPGDVLSVIGVGTSQVGATVTLADGQVTYDIGSAFQELAEGETVQDSFSYTIVDSKGAQAASLVNVTIVGANDAPVTADDAAIVVEDWLTVATGNVLANDSDVDAGAVLQVAGPGTYAGNYGSLTLAADGRYTYALDNAATKVQSLGREAAVVEHFAYTATDGQVGTGATLDVFLHGTNDAPIVVKPLADQDVTFNKPFYWQMPADSFKDVDAGDALTYTAKLADGSALPSWLSFDAQTLAFSGMSPKAVMSIDVLVTATDKVAATGNTTGSLSASDVFKLSISHGNQGVGNGQDAAPAGHTTNFNDGPGTSPGNPGAKSGKKNATTPASTSPASTSGAPTESTTEPTTTPLPTTSATGSTGSTTDASSDTAAKPLPAYLGSDTWSRYGAQAAGTGSSGSSTDPTAIFARWLAMDLAVSQALAEQPTAWADAGADVSVLNQASSGFLGSTTTFGKDTISLLSSKQSLQTFNGLGSGTQAIS